ncbi:phytoene/squalene synthase family protein [Lysobacter tyrosinilyticus]
MSEQESIDSFVQKWRARWPEWQVAEVFVPRGQREIALAWAALLQELTDAAWGGSDARPGEAKLGWWLEELQGWARGIRRHPLGLVLQKLAAPWPALGASLAALRNSRERPVDADDAEAQLKPFVIAIAAVEAQLFGDRAHEAGEGSDAIATCLLHMRLAHHPGEAAPLQTLAAAGDNAAVGTWARQLAGRGSMRGATRPRRLWAGLALVRLRGGEPAQPVSAARALWMSWRAARPGGRV